MTLFDKVIVIFISDVLFNILMLDSYYYFSISCELLPSTCFFELCFEMIIMSTIS